MVGGQVIVIDSTDGNKKLATVFVDTEVIGPPPPPPWALIAALCGAGILLVLFSWDRYRRWINPAGLQLALYDKDEEKVLSTSQPVQHGRKGPYFFSIIGDKIKPGRDEKESYRIHRWLPKGRLKIKNPSGENREIHEGQQYDIGSRSLIPSYWIRRDDKPGESENF